MIAQWNYILVAGEEEMKAGLVDVRVRSEGSKDGKRLGKQRVDDFAAMLKTLEPKVSDSYNNLYEKAWDPANFPRDQ